MKRICLLLLFLSLSLAMAAQEKRHVFVKKIDVPIKIDGVLDEAIWQEADKADDFWQFIPTDSIKSPNFTEVRMLYDDKNLYISVHAKAIGNDYAVTSLRRDFRGGTNDNISLLFDTFSDFTNAYLFGMTPYGVRREVLVSGGATQFSDFNGSWDIKWTGDATRGDKEYFLEMAIPFSSVKFPEGAKTWNFQTYRFDLQSNQRSIWARVPQNQLMANLAFLGVMEFEEPLGKNKTPLYFIPYVNAIAAKDFDTPKNYEQIKAGADAKIAVSNGLNLDLTVNPDFSNVEVDNIVTNLTRFEIGLPERRQFFIENSDLFNNFGSRNEAQPFFSRRIGIVRDTAGNSIENQIYGGLRLNGKIGSDWRLGVLSLQTASDPDNNIASYNNSMFALQKKVFARSNIGIFAVNKQTWDDEIQPDDQFNTVIGVDYDLASSDNTWTGNFYLHKSFQEGDSQGNYSTQALLTYNSRHWNFTTDWAYVDEEFRADLGFVPRTGVFKTGNNLSYTIYPKKGSVTTHSFQVANLSYFKPELDWKQIDDSWAAAYMISFRDQSEFYVAGSYDNIYLLYDFDPSRGGFDPIPGKQYYDFAQAIVGYETNSSKPFTFAGEVYAGEFFNGAAYGVESTLGYRFQPYVNISINSRYDHVNLPAPYAQTDIILISPRIDLTFTKSIFWSTLIQYSNQQNSLGINSRLQWRYAPLSDLFLVYNDNYYTQVFGPKYRSINLKLTYWFNI